MEDSDKEEEPIYIFYGNAECASCNSKTGEYHEYPARPHENCICKIDVINNQGTHLHSELDSSVEISRELEYSFTELLGFDVKANQIHVLQTDYYTVTVQMILRLWREDSNHEPIGEEWFEEEITTYTDEVQHEETMSYEEYMLPIPREPLKPSKR